MTGYLCERRRLLFQDTLDYLPEAAQRHEVALQNRWLDQRADAMTRAFLEDKDGEVARFAAGQAFIDETLKRMTNEEFAKVMGSEDTKEGLTAFIEKRLPNWQGR